MRRAQIKRKVPLTRREHVSQVIEGHWIIVSILVISWVTWIVIEMWTLYKYSWIICRRILTSDVAMPYKEEVSMKVKHASKLQVPTPINENVRYDTMWKCDHRKHARWINYIEAQLDDIWKDWTK